MHPEGRGYNERLFSGGLRAQLHLARFIWLREAVRKTGANCQRVLELGCFDGRALDYLPKVTTYKGFDADWEGGLGLAQARARNGVSFSFAATPEEMRIEGETFDTAICMETLEHVPPELVSPYLAKIAAHLRGYFFITVPVELGPLFLLKWLAKGLFSKGGYKYTASELFFATLGIMSRVERDDHKGFDYRALARQVAEYFEIVSVAGRPTGPLPLSFTACIVAKTKH